jgi:predicted nucleic acid-binding protein
MAGLTLDTGALIKLERRRLDIAKKIKVAIDHAVPITVPAVVVAEWWRGGPGDRQRATLLRMFIVEPLSRHLAQLAGHALGHVARAETIDAIVMASASLRGDTVYTSDLPDLERLQRAFPTVLIELA